MTDNPKVVTALGYFCRHNDLGTDGKETTLVGKTALDKKFIDLQSQVTASSRFSLKDLEPVHVYRWLLTDDQKCAVDEWTSTMLVAATSTRITTKRSATGSSEAASKRAKKREADADVSALFT